MNKIIFIILIIFIFSTHANAAEVVGTGKITYVENGWYGEGLVLHFSVGIDGCSAQNNDFAIDVNHPSYKELVSMALTAFSSSSDVQLIVEKGTCLFGKRTKVLSIRLIE